MTKIIVACLCAISLSTANARGQTPLYATRTAEFLQGRVSSVSNGTVTLALRDGTTETVTLVSTPKIYIASPASASRIVRGNYVATFNNPQADGSDISTEIRLYSSAVDPELIESGVNPGLHRMMVKGRVMAATSENGERILTVNYNSGERLLRVPQGTSITYIEPDGSTAMPLIKPGCNIAIFTRFSDGNRETEQAITLAKSDIRTAPTLSVHRPPTRPKG